MRELSLLEIDDISAGKFKFHFNVFQAVFTVVVSTLAGGPIGFGYAVGTLIAAQGVGQLHDMAVDKYGWEPLQ